MSREAYAESAPRSKPAMHALSPAVERALIAVVAVLLLVPCVWQPHIMAGDLSSHLYNAWLAGQIEEGTIQTRGLELAHPITNVLADWAMEPLLYTLGRSATERIVVGAAVEVIFCGAFAFVAAAAGQKCWIITPSLAMIAYGIIFHYGFLNFYVSAGLSLWIMALLWHPRRPWLWLAIPLAALALLAHPMPLAWAAAALLYVHAVRRVPESQRAGGFRGRGLPAGSDPEHSAGAGFRALVLEGRRGIRRISGPHGRGADVGVRTRISDRGCRNSARLVGAVSRTAGPWPVPGGPRRPYLGFEHGGLHPIAER